MAGQATHRFSYLLTPLPTMATREAAVVGRPASVSLSADRGLRLSRRQVSHLGRRRGSRLDPATSTSHKRTLHRLGHLPLTGSRRRAKRRYLGLARRHLEVGRWRERTAIIASLIRPSGGACLRWSTTLLSPRRRRESASGKRCNDLGLAIRGTLQLLTDRVVVSCNGNGKALVPIRGNADGSSTGGATLAFGHGAGLTGGTNCQSGRHRLRSLWLGERFVINPR